MERYRAIKSSYAKDNVIELYLYTLELHTFWQDAPTMTAPQRLTFLREQQISNSMPCSLRDSTNQVEIASTISEVIFLILFFAGVMELNFHKLNAVLPVFPQAKATFGTNNCSGQFPQMEVGGVAGIFSFMDSSPLICYVPSFVRGVKS